MTSQNTSLRHSVADTLLRTALRTNAMFSATTGVIMTLFAETVANDWLGFDEVWAIRFVGIALLMFAGSLVYDASRPQLNITKAMLTVAQDAGWVVGSIVLIIANPFDFSSGGLMLIAVVAAVVAVFAAVQELGIMQIKAARQ